MRTISLLDRRADLRHARAGTVHLHRVTRDINADRSRHAMWLPGRPAARVPVLDEAVVIVFVARVLASAEAGNVMQHLRVPRGERVHRPNDLHRACGCIETHGQRWQISCVGGRGPREGDCFRVACLSHGRCCRRLLWLRRPRCWRSFGLTSPRAREEDDCDAASGPAVEPHHRPMLAPVDILTRAPVI